MPEIVIMDEPEDPNKSSIWEMPSKWLQSSGDVEFSLYEIKDPPGVNPNIDVNVVLGAITPSELRAKRRRPPYQHQERDPLGLGED